MSRKQGHERAHGPYAHGNRWQVVIVGADGSRTLAKESDGGPSSFESREAAEGYIRAFRDVTNTRTVGEAVRDFVAHLRDHEGHRESSGVTAGHRLVGLLRLVEGDRRLSELKPAMTAQLAKRRQTEVAYETVRGELGYASRFAQWCIKRGWLASDPFAGVELIRPRERSRGKPQLRVDEARRFIATLTADPSPEATAVLVAILMGLRAHEIVERTVRDLDDGGRLLVIGKSKTRAGERTVAVPALLRDRLLSLASGKQPDEHIFATRSNSRGRNAEAGSRYWLHYHCVRFAELAGTMRVTPHGLRGSWATFAVTAQLPGVAHGTPIQVADVARTIGHNDGGATMRRHYLAPGAEESAATERVEGLLGATAPAEPPTADSKWN